MSTNTTTAAPAVRVPPHNDEIERSVLGCVFIDNAALDEISTYMRPEGFYRENHRHIFRAMIEMRERGEAIDVLTLTDHLAAKGLIEAVGGPTFLSRLSSSVPSVANADQYAALALAHDVDRQLIAEMTRAIDALHDGAGRSQGYKARLAERMATLAQATALTSPYVHVRQAVSDTLGELEHQWRNGTPPAISTPWADLNASLYAGGLRPGQLAILAARPAMGKSAVGMAWALGCALAGTPTGILSLEMTAGELTQRLLASMSGVPLTTIAEVKMSDDEWKLIISASGKLNAAPLHIAEQDRMSLDAVRQTIRRMVRVDGVQVVLIDYLTRIRLPAGVDARVGVTEISRSLKALAKELQIPIICLAQLNRGPEQRADKRPVASDLKESGAIEEDADLIVMLYRDAVYNEGGEDNVVELLIRKQRQGALGCVALGWDGATQRVTNLDTRHTPPPQAEKKQAYQSW